MNCLTCNQEFSKPKHESYKVFRKRKYCSVKCFHNGRKLTRKCLHCGEVFRVEPNRVERGEGKYCSMLCRNRGIRDPHKVQCFLCKKIIKRPPSKANRSKRSFCSREHYFKWRTCNK